MHQKRFPNIFLRRSEFDRGPGKWGPRTRYSTDLKEEVKVEEMNDV